MGSFSKEELLHAIRTSEARYKETDVYRQTLGNANYWGDQAPRDALKPYTNLLQDLEVGGRVNDARHVIG